MEKIQKAELKKHINVPNKIMDQLLHILDNEPEVLDKHISREKTELLQTTEKATAFDLHNRLVESHFGPADNSFEFTISAEMVKSLSAFLKTTQRITLEEASKKTYKGPLFDTNFRDPNKFKKIDENIITFDLTPDPIISELHKVVRDQIRDAVKSPFSIVNTRAWTTKPNAAEFGSNSAHKDGFHPGHMKIMVYLTPLSKDFGEFWIGGTTITGKESGFCFCFKNSDIIHSGIPGKMFSRICFEITILRTFLDCEQFHPGHVNGRYYSNLKTPYMFICPPTVTTSVEGH